MEKQIFTVERAAEHYGLSKSYLYKLAHYKRVAYHKPNKKTIFFLKEELDSYLLGNRIEASTKIDLEQEAAEFLIKSK
jgi:excisionase family DNA binding protein